jgi:hypothetical protein
VHKARQRLTKAEIMESSRRAKLLRTAIVLLLVALLPASAQQTVSSMQPDANQSDIQALLDRMSEGPGPDPSASTPVNVERLYPTDTDKTAEGRLSQALGFGYMGKVLLMVNSQLYNSIATSLSVFRSDLESEGYNVEIFGWSGGDCKDFRAFLQQQSDGLLGAILIGDLPIPWLQWALYYDTYWCDNDSPFFTAYDLPYMDLDGTWYDNNDDGAWDSADPHSNIEPEIWVGRLYASNLPWIDEVTAINGYLQRDHQYRIGNTVRPARALIFGSLIGYACLDPSDWETALNNLGYSEVVCASDPAGISNNKAAYLDSLSSGNYEFVYLLSHGGANRHWFRPSDEFVYSSDIQSVQNKALFLHDYSCGGSAWQVYDCVGSSYIFGNTSGLVTWGSTVIGSSVGIGNFYVPLSNGSSFGEAMKFAYKDIVGREYPNYTMFYRDCHEVCYDSSSESYVDSCFYLPSGPLVTLLGDPTLRPRKRTWLVDADGTGDAPTIQAALDSARAYDRIILAHGTYSGPGNWDVDFMGKPVSVAAEDDSGLVTIDCNGVGRAFHFHSNELPLSRLVGLTIVNAESDGDGGAILCENGASPQIIDCLVHGCTATGRGGAIALMDSSKAVIQGCTITGNVADSGGGVYLSILSETRVEYSIVAFNVGGGICYNGSNSEIVTCSDVYGNVGGDYAGGLDLATLNENFSSDPRFCDTSSDNFALNYMTPCQPDNNGCQEWVGCTRIECFDVCGDVDANGLSNVSDVVLLINYVFGSGSAPRPLSVGDVDCSGMISIADVVYFINYIFGGGQAPCVQCQ